MTRHTDCINQYAEALAEQERLRCKIEELKSRLADAAIRNDKLLNALKWVAASSASANSIAEAALEGIDNDEE